jgi:hypothetical protein
MALNRFPVTAPTAAQAIFLRATEPRAARPEGGLAARVMLIGRGGLAVSTVGKTLTLNESARRKILDMTPGQ